VESPTRLSYEAERVVGAEGKDPPAIPPFFPFLDRLVQLKSFFPVTFQGALFRIRKLPGGTKPRVFWPPISGLIYGTLPPPLSGLF